MSSEPWVQAQTQIFFARVYFKQGKYKEAEQLYRLAYNTRVNSLGPDHPLTARLLADLSELYLKCGKFAVRHSLIHSYPCHLHAFYEST